MGLGTAKWNLDRGQPQPPSPSPLHRVPDARTWDTCCRRLCSNYLWHIVAQLTDSNQILFINYQPLHVDTCHHVLERPHRVILVCCYQLAVSIRLRRVSVHSIYCNPRWTPRALNSGSEVENPSAINCKPPCTLIRYV